MLKDRSFFLQSHFTSDATAVEGLVIRVTLVKLSSLRSYFVSSFVFGGLHWNKMSKTVQSRYIMNYKVGEAKHYFKTIKTCNFRGENLSRDYLLHTLTEGQKVWNSKMRDVINCYVLLILLRYL